MPLNPGYCWCAAGFGAVQDMVEWKVKAASEADQVALNLSHHDLHVLPDLVVEFPALESLDLSYNFLIGGPWGCVCVCVCFFVRVRGRVEGGGTRPGNARVCVGRWARASCEPASHPSQRAHAHRPLTGLLSPHRCVREAGASASTVHPEPAVQLPEWVPARGPGHVHRPYVPEP